MTVLVRRALVSDAEVIGEIHVSSWRSAYKGIIKKSTLDGFSVDARASSWRRKIEALEKEEILFVVEKDGVVKGFLFAKPIDAETNFYLQCLYLSPNAFGEGLGGHLLSALKKDCRKKGYKTISLEVLSENKRARNFYEKHGCVCIPERHHLWECFDGEKYPSEIYLFKLEEENLR